MARESTNLYSRFIAWIKIILPLIGLAILSSLFLFSNSRTPTDGSAFFDGDLSRFANREHITGPRFAGTTPSGEAITLSAKEASPRQNAGNVFDAAEIEASIEFLSGESLEIRAIKGVVDSENMVAELSGGISLSSTLGYRAETAGMTFKLDRLDIRSHGTILATGPLGEITAGEMFLGLEGPATENVTQGYVLVFKNRVKLIYKPD